MKAKFGTFFMILGALLVAGAIALFLMNQQEQTQAAEASDAVMPHMITHIQQRQAERLQEDATQSTELVPAVGYEEEVKEMTVTEIDGHGYIGFVSIPSLSLELPVMADWSYDKLKIAPCRYTGNLHADDLVIMAHNYNRHFGQLSNLHIGDTVIFTDMDGNMVEYQVVATDVLQPTDVEDMTSGDYDLTLFTCTYGGRSRVTVYCDRVEEEGSMSIVG